VSIQSPDAIRVMGLMQYALFYTSAVVHVMPWVGHRPACRGCVQRPVNVWPAKVTLAATSLTQALRVLAQARPGKLTCEPHLNASCKAVTYRLRRVAYAYGSRPSLFMALHAYIAKLDIPLPKNGCHRLPHRGTASVWFADMLWTPNHATAWTSADASHNGHRHRQPARYVLGCNPPTLVRDVPLPALGGPPVLALQT
jgi:hypothetical protein